MISSKIHILIGALCILLSSCEPENSTPDWYVVPSMEYPEGFPEYQEQEFLVHLFPNCSLSNSRATKLHNAASDKFNLRNYKDAEVFLKHAIGAALQTCDTLCGIRSAHDLAICYFIQGNYKRALYLLRSARLLIPGRYPELHADLISSHTLITSRTSGSESRALQGFHRAFRFAEMAADTGSMIEIRARMILLHLKNKNIKQAEELLEQSLAWDRPELDVSRRWPLFHAATSFYEQIGRKNEALHFARAALRLAEYGDLLSRKLASADLLIRIFEQENRLDSALHYEIFRDDWALNRERARDEELQHQLKLEQKYTLHHRELQAKAHLDRQKRIFSIKLSVVAALLLMGVVIFLLIQKNRVRKNRITLDNLHSAIEQNNLRLTEQTRALEELNLTKDKIFTIISHDLRGPILSLKSMVELWSSGQVKTDDFQQFLPLFSANINQVSSLLDNLLHWAGTQIHQLKPQIQDIDPEQLIQTLHTGSQPLAARKNISLKWNVSSGTTVRTDPHYIEIILRNLVSNAIKFSHTNSEIHIEIVVMENGSWFCSVKDSGVGMSEEDLEKLRVAGFFTKKGTQNEKGTGLGFLLCRELCRQLGGSLQIKSKPGEGTCIRCVFKPIDSVS